MNVRNRFAQCALGFDVIAARSDPRLELSDHWRALSSSTFEALLERLARALGFGIDVEDCREEFDAGERTRITASQRLDQLAARMRVAATSLAAAALDTVVRGGAVAHHTREFVALEFGLEVVGVTALGVQKVRVAVVALQKPQSTGAQAEWMLDVEHRDRRRVQTEVARAQCSVRDVVDDRIQQVDRSAARRR